MSRQCQLIMVTENNNNKFYNMYEEGSQIRIEYGRVGSAVRTCTKPISQWDKVYREKTGKGYKDITSLKTEVKLKGYKEIEDIEVKNIVDKLIGRSKQAIAENYRVGYKDVSEAQIREAQNRLDFIILSIENNGQNYSIEQADKDLLGLFTIIPRKMKKVQDHLLSTYVNKQYSNKDKAFITIIREYLSREQDLLDAMATQVAQNKIQEGSDENKTILEQLEIEIDWVDPNGNQWERNTHEWVKKKLGNNASQLKNIYRVDNYTTRRKFDVDLNDAKETTTHYFWHGSRTENWWSIISTGLMIRPSNAIYTGSMYGDGLYFADKAQKSLGYTSLNNSYWARGNDNVGYLALYEVRVGKQYVVDAHTSECYKFSKKYIGDKGYDSVFAKAGKSLINNEYIVYSPEQCTVRYLVEIGK